MVTAQKRAESLQEVPISAAALGRDEMDIQAIQNLTDISQAVPNFVANSFNLDPTTVRLFIRGIGQNDVQITQDPSVALYLDGVYIGTSFGAGFDGVDIDRVEVLRSPQGTLYGRNATGGAVNLVTRRADVDHWEARQDLITGNLGKRQSQTVVNIPIAGKVGIKLNYLYNQRGGYVENLGSGEDFGQQDRRSTVLDLRIAATDTFTVDYRYENATLKDSQRCDQVLEFGDGFLANSTQFIPPQASSDRQDEVTPLREIVANDQNIAAHSLWLDWALSDSLTLKSITALREVDSLVNSDVLATATGDYSAVGGGVGAPSVGRIDTEFEQRSQEFQLLGDSAHWQTIIGLYAYRDSATQDLTDSIRVGAQGTPDLTETENQSMALYGQATWNPAFMAQRWHFTLGARYSRDHREASRVNLLAFPPVVGDYDNDFENFNPALTVGYDIGDNMHAYGKIVTGYKSGGTSTRSANAELFARGFDEEEIINYELGFKGDFWRNRARLNAALFYMDIDGLQTSVITGILDPSGRDFLPVDGNTIYGTELDLSLLLSEGLTFEFSYGHLKTQLGQDSVTTPAGVSYELSDVMPCAPKHSYSLSADYWRPLPLGSLGLNLNYNWQDEVSTSPNIDEETIIDSYGLLGASASWSDIAIGSIPGEFRLILWGRNLTDTEYGLYRSSSWSIFGAADVQTFGDPPAAMVSA